jgi:hypothetical protein
MMQNLSIAPLLPGSKIELPNIYYNYNDATLRPDARKDLDLVVTLMNQTPTLMVELASHTDSRGTHKYNEELSQRRANGVVEYLVNHGIARNRLTPHGYGESEPRNSCLDGVSCTEQEHARNRRTEVRVLSGVNGTAMMYVDGQVSGVDRRDESSNATDQRVNSAPSSISVSQANGNTFYVVAGSFRLETGAQTRHAELLNLGYDRVEIIQFQGSPFYSVCVDKYDNKQEANVVRRKLEKENKIEAFVKAVQ